MICLCFILLHTLWSVIFFDALDNGNKMRVNLVVISHLVASGLTLLNRSQSYAACVVPLYGILVITAVVAFRVAGGSLTSLKASIKFQTS